MRKLIVMFAFVAVLTPMSVFASMYGVLSGRVVDTDGKGVVGATVLIEGTTRGTNVRTQNGSFTISNITAGNYTVRVRAVGKQEHKVNVRISVDQTTNINVTLRDDAVAIGEVHVVAAREGAAKVDATSVGSINTLTSDELTRSTSTSITAVVALSAGVSSGGDGYAVRGSRTSETQIRLDGLNMGDQFAGGFGGNARYFPMVSAYSTEEVQVITGNFSAQYGDAQGGIINSVMKTGRTDRFEGHLFFMADGILAGSQKSGTKVIHDGDKFKLIDGGEGAKLLTSQNKFIDVGFGGPLSFLDDRSTFYLSVGHTFEPYNNAYDIKDPWGNSMGRSPVSGSWMKNIEGRLNFGLTNDIKLLLGGKFGLTNRQSTGFRYYYDVGTPYRDKDGNITPLGEATPNGISGEVGKASASNQFVNNAFARINHTLTDRSFYEFTVAIGENNSESGRKVAGSELNYFTGFELMMPEDKWIVDGDKWSLATATMKGGKITGDKVIDWASPVSYVGLSKDKYCFSTWNGVNPFTGYYEGDYYSGSTNNPWGTNNMSNNGGTGGIEFRYANWKKVDGNYNLYGLETGNFKHTMKAGFEATYYTMHRHYNGTPYTGNPDYDIFTDKWGANIYAESDDVYNKTNKPINQFKLGMYVQDQIAYKGLIITPGLRLDIMDPMNKYRVVDTKQPAFVPISSHVVGVGGFEDATVKFRVSPRINVNYPITDKSYISLSYGQFFQTPAAYQLYDRFNLEMMRAGTLVGDPNMEAQQTNQYEVTYNNQITDEFMFSVAAYFKDIYNQLGVSSVNVAPRAYLQYAVSEYGSSRGVEFQVQKSLTNYFAFRLNYTLAYLTVTSSDINSNRNPMLDPYSGLYAFPLAPYYSSSDVRHLVKGDVFFSIGKGEGPTVANMLPLQNTTLVLEPFWRTGYPYTMSDVSGMGISERNVYRHPSAWNVNLKATKSFYLRDWFGEGMKNSMIEFQVSIDNVFNRREPLLYHSFTHDPLDDGRGLNTVLLGHFLQTPLFKEATHANPASWSPEQYDQYGFRLYNAAADLDGNGIITQQEKYEAWKKRYEEVTIQNRSYFQSPITVNAGVYIKF